MTRADKSPQEIAADLEDRLFRLYDRAGRPVVTWTDRGPSIVWTHDGPRLSRTAARNGDPALAAEINSAELRLETFLRQYRPRLESIPRWRAYYADHDPAHDDGMPSLQDGYRYHVHLHAPAPSWRVPEIVYQARTLAEACTRTLDQLGEDRMSSLAGGNLVLDVTDRLDLRTPRLYLVGTLPALTDKLHTFTREYTVALALRLAQSARRHQQFNIEPAWKVAAARTMPSTTVGSEIGPEETSHSAPIENLAARWATAEAARRTYGSGEPNRWGPNIEKAGIDLSRVRAEARRIDDSELAVQSQHPKVRYHDALLRSYITYYTNQHIHDAQAQHTELGIGAAPDTGATATESAAVESIRHLIDTAHPHSSDVANAPLTNPHSQPYDGPDLSVVHHLEP